jgi:hypothetical protein
VNSLVAFARGQTTAKALFASSGSQGVNPQFATAVLAIMLVAALWVSVGRLRKQGSATVAFLLHMVTVAAFVVFMFGWWVQERAILAVALPLTLLGTRSPSLARTAIVLNAVAVYSLFVAVPYDHINDLAVYSVQIVHWALYVTFSGLIFRALHGMNSVRCLVCLLTLHSFEQGAVRH